MKQARRWHLAHSRSKSILTLAEANTVGVIEPGQPVRMIVGKNATGRPDPRSSAVYDAQVDELDLVNNTVTVSAPDMPSRVIARNARVRLAFSAPQGLYICAGPVKSAVTEEGSLRLEIEVSGLNWIEEREHIRVRIPGARATCRTTFRSVDCPVVDISPKGMKVKGLADIPAGTEITIKLAVPLLPITEIIGKVVWTETDPFGVTQSGVQFTQMPLQFRDHLMGMCLLFHAVFN